MDEQLRHNIRERWFDSLFELAHLDYQKRLWIEAAVPKQIGDYAEAICRYFDDLNLEEGYDYFIKKGFVSEQEANIVKEFHRLLDSYVKRPEKKSLSGENILKDPEWIDLTKLAKANWRQLKTVIVDRGELDYIASLEKDIL